mmetsp:Transcript_2380/g.3292  ORF Transcript_2380/g.3292 Transcript_2380/m.3292 type:complete len:327 (+) Transcript_2380:69-1049(+)|eukprot:CAMPEP_0185267968 /NCGR_PEP_ID=MMETSP1359-20130426/35774_1 /TAXON_ID=552665 /ORGANISM="Bigelowiella longifila, Strain CCMP242" /LENGTH=326 /DNA_ID=CAMNT_0027858535 /DNA_START=51 /DNA_END=1031 /DNA_ORIENTATION=+
MPVHSSMNTGGSTASTSKKSSHNGNSNRLRVSGSMKREHPSGGRLSRPKKQSRRKLRLRRKKSGETPNPFANIKHPEDTETDWTNFQFVPQSPANMVPIAPTSSPAMPVTKEKILIPDVSCSPLSPLPQGLADMAKNTPPPYITLDSLPIPAAFDVKLEPYDPKGNTGRSKGGMGSLASFNNHRKMELQFTMGLASFATAQRKDPKQVQDAIQEQVNRLKKLSQADNPLLGGLDFSSSSDSSSTATTPSTPGTYTSVAPIAIISKKDSKATIAPKVSDSKSKQYQTSAPGGTPTATISNCSTAAFDQSQLSLLQSYMKQNGGVVPF